MIQKGKISIIVPIYNVEPYLKKCIISILNQSYTNIEVILVDDGATDGCGNICDEFTKKDSRIKVIHIKNGGLSSARNAGLEIATGEYIGFVDSDDWIEPDMYRNMLDFMVLNNCDLVECGVNIITSRENIIYETSSDEVMSGKEALDKQLTSFEGIYMPRIAVWSKLYKKSFWEHRRFPEGHIHEDYMLTCEALYEANCVGLLKRGLYNHYVSNAGSIMNSKFGTKDLYLETQYYNRIAYLQEKDESILAQKADEQYLRLLLKLYWKCAFHKMKEADYYLDLIYKNRDKIENQIKGKKLLEFRMVWINPKLYLLVRKIGMKIREISS